MENDFLRKKFLIKKFTKFLKSRITTFKRGKKKTNGGLGLLASKNNLFRIKKKR